MAGFMFEKSGSCLSEEGTCPGLFSKEGLIYSSEPPRTPRFSLLIQSVFLASLAFLAVQINYSEFP
jgi:hypothetical protein